MLSCMDYQLLHRLLLMCHTVTWALSHQHQVASLEIKIGYSFGCYKQGLNLRHSQGEGRQTPASFST